MTRGKTEVAPGSVRITNQFRQRKNMVYELRNEGGKLILWIRARDSAEDPSEFCLEARVGTGDEVATITEWGMTKVAALRAVASAWSAQSELAIFDWVAVEGALTAVRAI
jgi:hypothetical protein